jgi:hypothetical protein
MTTLRITAFLDAPVVTYHGLHLDGILAHAVVERVTGGAMLPQTPDYVPVELPLRVAWYSPAGVPLWCSTDLLPVDGTTDTLWMHRRALEPHYTRVNLQTGKGRYKERRSPLPALTATRLVAYVDGDADAIADLLRMVTSIGKKRLIAGRVREWRVEALEREFTFIEDGVALRPVPHLYLYGEERLETGALLSYSPPYWHVATRAICVPCGASV